MCRFTAYIGKPIILAEVLFQPKNSLIRQSMHAREMADKDPTNGDGFGVGWYNPEISSDPALFTSVLPAWNDQNLLYISPKIYSSCFLAHVRAASQGGVSQFNCHPFHYQRFLFMHNGTIGGFSILKRHIRHLMSDPIYDWVKGQTDSEHFAGLFLENFFKQKVHYHIEEFAKIFIMTLHQINKLREKYEVKETAYINYVISDGRSLLAARYTSDLKEGASTLYYSAGDSLCIQDGICHMHKKKSEDGAVLVVSEKLDSHQADWQEVPINQMLLVDDDLSIKTMKVE